MKAYLERSLLAGIFAIGLMGFAWPLWIPATANTDLSGWLALALMPLILIAAFALNQGPIAGPRKLAMLAVLSALAAATRIATSGVGGFELIFAIVILGAAAMGARFGFLLGASSVLLSSLFFGGIGPWTAFQMFAVGWVGFGAGALGARFALRKPLVLAAYGFFASYVFGLIMNLWFWPFAIGPTTSISYQPDAGLSQNLVSFLTYTLVSSTLTWDTLRAISTAAVILLVGKPVLLTLNRYRF